VDVKTLSGGLYKGRISEITNDYVCLIESGPEAGQQVYISFNAVESMIVEAADERG